MRKLLGLALSLLVVFSSIPIAASDTVHYPSTLVPHLYPGDGKPASVPLNAWIEWNKRRMAFDQDTSIIATARKTSWSAAGSSTLFTSRTSVCRSVAPYDGGPGIINSAIASCAGTNQVVQLQAGTFHLSSGINFAGASGVTLRGAGPRSTTLVFTGWDSCGGLGSIVCVMALSPPFPPDTPRNRANWTANYGQNTTTITLSSVANLSVGAVIILDQLDDATPAIDAMVNCANRNGTGTVAEGSWCSGEGAGGLSMDTQRLQNEEHVVTAIVGNNVTISPGVQAPNWTSSKSPQAWWSSSAPIFGVGIENMKIDGTNDGCSDWLTSCGGIMFNYARDSWVRNVEIFKSSISQVKLYETSGITLRDSYIHSGKTQGSTAYGWQCFYCSNTLVENNYFQDIVAMALTHGAGNVVAYNLMTDNTYNPFGNPFPPGNSTMQDGAYVHNGGGFGTLWEGNEFDAFKQDAIHGSSNAMTLFRNRSSGYENLKSVQTNPMIVYAWNRCDNIIGNVLGTSGYHDTYAQAFYDKSIFRLGETPYYCPWNGTNVGTCVDIGGFQDARVVASTMLWGNWDTVTNGSRFNSSEVPSGVSWCSNAVPPNNTLPSSFYRTTAPGFFATTSGTVPWPAIGPDVTGGNVSDVGGHYYKIPMRVCAESLSHAGGNPNLLTNYDMALCWTDTLGSAPVGDVTPPTISITTPADDSTVTTAQTIPFVGGFAMDAVGVTSCEYSLNGGAWTATGGTVPNFVVNAPALVVGPNVITIRCRDAANNVSAPTFRIVSRRGVVTFRPRIGG